MKEVRLYRPKLMGDVTRWYACGACGIDVNPGEPECRHGHLQGWDREQIPQHRLSVSGVDGRPTTCSGDCGGCNCNKEAGK